MSAVLQHAARAAGLEEALSGYRILIDLSPARLLSVLAGFGSPQDKTPPVFHVAGTNGKGSTLAFLQAIFEAAGKKVHKFTGPHLVCPSERIVLAGSPIDRDYFSELIAEVGFQDRLSRFEAMTAAAFLAFARMPADVVLLETGLGGRGDATNVVRRPSCTLLSRISLDHQRLLGRTAGEIAAQKAGIFREGVPAVVGEQFFDDATGAIDRALAQTGARPWRFGREWRSSISADGGVHYNGHLFSGVHPAPSLLGDHQYANAALAMAAVDAVGGFGLDRAAVAEGLVSAVWPGRFQRLRTGPLCALLPPGMELWIDGAHNDSGALALAAQLRRWRREGPVHLILGMKRRKNPADFSVALGCDFDSLQTCGVPENGLCHDPVILAGHFSGASPAISPAFAVLRAAALSFSGTGRIVIAGSLALAGHILRDHG